MTHAMPLSHSFQVLRVHHTLVLWFKRFFFTNVTLRANCINFVQEGQFHPSLALISSALCFLGYLTLFLKVEWYCLISKIISLGL